MYAQLSLQASSSERPAFAALAESASWFESRELAPDEEVALERDIPIAREREFEQWREDEERAEGFRAYGRLIREWAAIQYGIDPDADIAARKVTAAHYESLLFWQ